MKTKKLLFSIAILFTGYTISAQDLAPGINYSYNPPGSNGIITSISVDALENDGVSVGSFDVAMYLYDQSTTNYWVIGTTNIPSLSGNSVITISNWNIDINNTSGIPAGTYRLGVWVDSNNDITESDENNNAGLLAGNINYTPNASGIATSPLAISFVSCFPNPANENTTLKFSLANNSDVSIQIFDMTGKLVKIISDKEQMMSGDYSVNISTSELPDGIYFISISTVDGNISKKITVAH